MPGFMSAPSMPAWAMPAWCWPNAWPVLPGRVGRQGGAGDHEQGGSGEDGDGDLLHDGTSWGAGD